MGARYGSNVESAQLLLKAGAEVKISDDADCTPMHYAAGEPLTFCNPYHGRSCCPYLLSSPSTQTHCHQQTCGGALLMPCRAMLERNVVPCLVTHHHKTSSYTTSHHTMHTPPHHTQPHHATSRHTTPHHGTPHHITSQHSTSHHTTSRHVTPHHITSQHSTSQQSTSLHST